VTRRPRAAALAAVAPAAAADGPRLLTVKEVGQRLGISHDSVHRLITAGALQSIDVRTTGPKPRLRIAEAELNRFLKEREIPASSRRKASL
jgi:excisionase family DNA binding protein